MKAKLPQGVLLVPTCLLQAVPGNSERGRWGLTWSPTLEEPLPGEDRERRQGGYQSVWPRDSHQKHVKGPRPQLGG